MLPNDIVSFEQPGPGGFRHDEPNFYRVSLFFFSSYIEAMTCIRNLLERCPEDTHKDISIALVNLRGMDQELQDLCLTNGLYESMYCI